MIELDHVTKIYTPAGGVVRALDDVSLAIPRGQYVAIRGPSGCGKSTLLSLAAGLDRPTQGRVLLGGVDLASISSAQRARMRAEQIGFVFQLFHLLPYLNVLDNVLVAALPGRATAARDKARELLEKFGLGGRFGQRASQLSVGERQRVAMARALLNDPKLLLADEPTGNLDAETARVTLETMAEFHRRGGTVLLVTHSDDAAARAERRLQMRQGKWSEEPVSAASGASQ